MFELLAGDSAAKGTAKSTVLYAIDRKPGYKGKRTEPVPGFVVDRAQITLRIHNIQGEEAFSHIVSVLQSTESGAKMITSYVKNAADCEDLCPQREDFNIVNRSLDTRWLQLGNVWKSMYLCCSGEICSRIVHLRLHRRGSNTTTRSTVIALMGIRFEIVK